MNERQVPVITTLSAIILYPDPPFIVPQVKTPASRGSLDLETTDCNVVTKVAATTTESTVYCGAAPCPPFPLTEIENLSLAAIIGPFRAPTRPNESYDHR